MHPRKRLLAVFMVLTVLAIVLGWYFLRPQERLDQEPLEASGTVEAIEIRIAPELSGRVVAVLVEKGDYVEEGQALFQLDGTLLEAQHARALAALESAKAAEVTASKNLLIAETNVHAAEIALESARIQFEMALYAAHQAETPFRLSAWRLLSPQEFEQPVWYFEKNEQIDAARKELEAARESLTQERANFSTLLDATTMERLKEAEERLAQARIAFEVAQEVLNRAKAQRDEQLKDAAQALYDAAEAELNAAQDAYENLLAEETSQEVLEARARLAVAQARYDAALEHLGQLLSGEQALQVRAAELGRMQAEITLQQAQIGVEQARAAEDQAHKAVLQVEAELKSIEVQLSKLTVIAPVSGVVLSKNVEPGEVLQGGAIVMTLGRLDRLQITVYVPEDRYGRIALGEQAEVFVDSFPGEKFTATVVYIADQAEFTPRNVQTAEGRRTTVFAVELSIDNPQRKLKPGMPVDVRFASK